VLADWGADVIKIEHPEGGDAQRGLMQLGSINIQGRVNPLMQHANRGKRSVGLDMKSEEGLELLYEIARSSDVFLTNFRPAARQKMRIDVEHIREVNPSIIYARGSAYGADGPERDVGGYDMTGFWCRAGSAASVSPPSVGIISQPGPAYGDSIGGMTIAGGIAAALFARERTGEPAIVDASLLSVGSWAMGAAVNTSLISGTPWPASNGGNSVAPTNPLTGVYELGDGNHVGLSMLQGARYWPGFCECIGRPDLGADERFASPKLLAENAGAAADELRAVFAGLTLEAFRAALDGFDGQWAAVQDTVQLGADPQARVNGIIVPVDDGDEQFEVVASPVRFDESAFELAPCPEFAAHTEELLLELGHDWDSIIELKEHGAIT
jgi:crotonobetainyl-CoA:carnitine CoA-transferase CaiB-like acyl-CoA transferase